MNKMRFSLLCTLVVFLFTLNSCDDGNGTEDLPESTGVLITNEGNFGSGNGSISFYSEDSMAIANNVIEDANNGADIGSLVQSVFGHDGVGYMLCNDANKVEFFDLETFAFMANPETDISVPRYMTVVGDRGYITCWGPWDFSDFTLPDSYLAVLDLSTNQVVDSLESGSGPEGIIAVGNKLYVANSAETTVSIIDLNNNSTSKMNVGASPKQFVADAAGNIWVTLVSAFGVHSADKVGLLEINTSTDSRDTFIEVANMSENGNIAVNGDKSTIYFLTVEPWEPNKVNYGAEVRVLDAGSKTVDSTPLITGQDFYGLGYNVTTDLIYVADSKAFTGPGKIFVYDTQGMMQDDQITSVGPNGFLFR